MDLYTINVVKNNKLIYDYLRVDSSWYEKLNESSVYLKEVEEAAKKYYGITPEQKLKRLSENIDKITNLLDILK